MIHPGRIAPDPEPPEFCEDEAMEGSDYCEGHAEWADDP
jgi:hypothetical protein